MAKLPADTYNYLGLTAPDKQIPVTYKKRSIFSLPS